MRLFTNQEGGRWPKVPLEVNTMFYLKGDLMEVEDGGGPTEEKHSVILDWINSISPKTWLLFVEYVHDGGWDEFHHRVHDALLLLLVATASWHRLLWTGEAALRGLLHRSRCLRFLLLFLLDAVLDEETKTRVRIFLKPRWCSEGNLK